MRTTAQTQKLLHLQAAICCLLQSEHHTQHTPLCGDHGCLRNQYCFKLRLPFRHGNCCPRLSRAVWRSSSHSISKQHRRHSCLATNAHHVAHHCLMDTGKKWVMCHIGRVPTKSILLKQAGVSNCLQAAMIFSH